MVRKKLWRGSIISTKKIGSNLTILSLTLSIAITPSIILCMNNKKRKLDEKERAQDERPTKRRKILLKANDEIEPFTAKIDENIAKEAKLLGYTKNNNDLEPFPLPNIDKETLKKIIPLLKKAASSKTTKKLADKIPTPLFSEFLDLINATNFLHAPKAFKALCYKFAQYLNSKDKETKIIAKYLSSKLSKNIQYEIAIQKARIQKKINKLLASIIEEKIPKKHVPKNRINNLFFKKNIEHKENHSKLFSNNVPHKIHAHLTLRENLKKDNDFKNLITQIPVDRINNFFGNPSKTQPYNDFTKIIIEKRLHQQDISRWSRWK